MLLRIDVRCLWCVAFLAVILLSSPSFAAEAAGGLVAEWTFEEGKGEVAADASGNNNDGALRNNPEWVEDGIGTALKFDGVDDYVDCGATETLEIKKQISLEAWVYPIEPSSGAGEPLILGKGIYAYGLVYNPGTIWFYISSGGWHCVSEIPTKEWTHVVGTYDGKKMRLYINGNFYTGYTMPQPDTPIKNPEIATYTKQKCTVLIGSRGDAHFRGMVDNARIYNRPLSKEEVKAHYLAEKKLVKQPPPVPRKMLKGLALKVYDAGDSEKALVITSRETVSSDLTVPSNIRLKFETGGVCEVTKGVTLTINGSLEAPLTQIFRGAGKVVIGGGYMEKVYPQWWGAKAGDGEDDTSPIQAAIDSGRAVFFHGGRYDISSRLVIYSGSILEGALSTPEIHATETLPAMLQRPDLTPPPDGIHYNYATRIDNIRITNLRFHGEDSVIGLDFTNTNYVWLENVAVTNCRTGIMMAELGMYNTFISPVISRCETGMEWNIGTMNNNIFGGRIAVVKTGILVNLTSQLNIYGITFDAYDEVGVDIKRGDQVNLNDAWFDSVPPSVAVRVGPRVSACSIINPRFSGPIGKAANRVDDQSGNTLILDAAGDANSTLTGQRLKASVLYTEGISATATRAMNLRGQATIGGANKQVVVKFPTPEPDEEYFITATVVSTEGSPAPEARNTFITGKSAGGFNLHLQKAPGEGNSVKVDWILVR